MGPDRGAVLAAWAETKAAAWTMRTRGDVGRRQDRLWAKRAPVVAATPAVQDLAGRPLADFPVMGAAEVRQDFDRWNTLGLTAAQAVAAAQASEATGDGEVAPGVSAGFSTGSDGQRGVFLAGPAERARYIGQALAKLLPATGLLRPWRIALSLRADNRLYRDAGGAGRIRFQFFGLDMDPVARARALEAFAPDVLIAPAHVLAGLATLAQDTGTEGFRVPSLKRLFWGAEPMGLWEREWIGAALGRRPEPIYQATEGFLGAPCRLGVLHLNEDALVVELEPVPGAANRFRPIVTDLFRTSQPVIRLRLDDLIEPLAEPCACGSPLRAVNPIEGRIADLWRWGEHVVCPREIDWAVEQALGPSGAWRAEAGPDGVRVETAERGDQKPARDALRALLAAIPGVNFTAGQLPPTPWGAKRRRVRWRG
jgi:putative adenylate-forming enzyme